MNWPAGFLFRLSLSNITSTAFHGMVSKLLFMKFVPAVWYTETLELGSSQVCCTKFRDIFYSIYKFVTVKLMFDSIWQNDGILLELWIITHTKCYSWFDCWWCWWATPQMICQPSINLNLVQFKTLDVMPTREKLFLNAIKYFLCWDY
jgi:hypothetical protein